MPKKSEEQWRKDNGVPADARDYQFHNGFDTVKFINGLLKKHKLRVRTKYRRGSIYDASYTWVEKLP